MGTHQKLITEDLYKQAIAQLASTNKENRIAIRLRAIVAAKEHGIGMVSKIFDIIPIPEFNLVNDSCNK
ncbi:MULTISPECIES: hypothetical protein [unclassified Candidatus Tisiphia]|uniref:hypothetical protein n=1 Tax=unclassified Candidatus Tisiphia TaxID=2996318 RepID=UPI0035C91DFE